MHRHAFEHVALHKFGRTVVADFVKVKNSDHREATLVVDGQVVLRACLTYGFRNIQNLVRAALRCYTPAPLARARLYVAHRCSQIRSIKGQKSIPHFVEVPFPTHAPPPLCVTRLRSWPVPVAASTAARSPAPRPASTPVNMRLGSRRR